MRLGPWAVLALAALAPAGLSEGGDKPQRTELSLRAFPRAALPPAEIRFVAAIEGDKGLADYHCPEVEWDWDDGSRSVQQSDCAPDEPESTIERRFSSSHVYAAVGDYRVSITLRRAKRSLARATTSIMIR